MTQPDVDQLFALAEHHADAGNWPAARAGYARVLASCPSHADAMLQLSYAESFMGHYRDARNWALRATAGELPSRPGAVIELIRRLRTFNEALALHQLATRLLADPGTPNAILAESARQLAILDDPDTALGCADAAVRAAPEDPPARLAQGQLLAHHGRLDEAAAAIESVLRRHPRIAQGWWMLSRLRRQTPDANHVPQLRALLRTPGLGPDDVAAAGRALHKELDDLGDYEGAWQALELMCRARRGSLRHDPRSTAALVDALMAWSANAGSVRGVATGGRIPLFIVGMHRSGTTLLEQLLDGSPEVRAAGELNDFTAAMRFASDQHGKGTLDQAIIARAPGIDFAQVGMRYMEGVAWRLGDEPFFTDKQPANFLNAGFICRALPQARILHLVRDPVETCFSNLRELYSGINEHSYDQRELAAYFVQYRRLMAHWHESLPGRILDVSYSALTRDPAGTMREVAEWCGLPYVPAMSDTRSSSRAVSTASSVQVRERVTAREIPKWVPYAPHLQPLIDALREGGIAAGGRDSPGG